MRTDGSSWRHRASPSVLEFDLCAQGHEDLTSVDRRWLWRLESFLAIDGTTDAHRQMATDLHYYLNETCEHHWHHADDGDWVGVPAHRQCSWCNVVVMDSECAPA